MACINSDTITFYKGDSLDVEFTINWEDGSPVDLTNYNARFIVESTAISKVSTNPSQIELLTPLTAGKIKVMLKPADTSALVKNFKYTYDAEIYDSTNIYTFAQGIFKVV